MNSYHRFTRDQIETIKDFYIKHRDRKWSDPIKRRDLYDLMQTTDLSERQIYTFCRNKKFRDKNSSIRRTTIWKPLRNILHDMKDLESSPDCQKDIMKETPGNHECVTLRQESQDSKRANIALRTTHKCEIQCKGLAKLSGKGYVQISPCDNVFNPLQRHSCRCLPMPYGLKTWTNE
eukprot:CAMPEP_0114994034 /NCGR_PEP_ID=MMETSP0216-20121206/12885_1 /TAXON_ID=223996 /ORGANISM="Protocruzia adherens, Strain Boccale" /LENGTH=176 /DNA_ID=CAMNT_0002357791 /DNA_START=188 /DNA_END=718 /DNA_ORIENTATION=+